MPKRAKTIFSSINRLYLLKTFYFKHTLHEKLSGDIYIPEDIVTPAVLLSTHTTATKNTSLQRCTNSSDICLDNEYENL